MIANKESISHRECAFMQQCQLANRIDDDNGQVKKKGKHREYCVRRQSFAAVSLWHSLGQTVLISGNRQQNCVCVSWTVLFRYLTVCRLLCSQCTYDEPTRLASDNESQNKCENKMKSYFSADRQCFYFILCDYITIGYRWFSLFTTHTPAVWLLTPTTLHDSYIYEK